MDSQKVSAGAGPPRLGRAPRPGGRWASGAGQASLRLGYGRGGRGRQAALLYSQEQSGARRAAGTAPRDPGQLLPCTWSWVLVPGSWGDSGSRPQFFISFCNGLGPLWFSQPPGELVRVYPSLAEEEVKAHGGLPADAEAGPSPRPSLLLSWQNLCLFRSGTRSP